LNADLNAACNIRWRADVNQPIAVCQRVLARAHFGHIGDFNRYRS
jgi:transposase